MYIDVDYNKSSARYYKQAVTGDSGGLILLETGVSQPFFYIKLSYVDKSMIGNQPQNESTSMVKKILVTIKSWFYHHLYCF